MPLTNPAQRMIAEFSRTDGSRMKVAGQFSPGSAQSARVWLS